MIFSNYRLCASAFTQAQSLQELLEGNDSCTIFGVMQVGADSTIPGLFTFLGLFLGIEVNQTIGLPNSAPQFSICPAVNLASRMESTGVPGRVQCTKEVIDAVPANEFVVERRGMVQVKGIGEMETYFINAKSATSRPSSYYWNKLRSSVLDGSRQDAKSTKKQTFRDIVELLQEARQLDNANISDDQGSELE